MDVIRDFVAATDGDPSPEIFRRWTAISMVSAMLSRRVWTSLGRGKKTYGNTFVMLVGDPGSGKSTAINAAKYDILFRSMEGIDLPDRHMKFCRDKVTPAEMVADMADCFMGYKPGGLYEEFQWSYNIWTDEAGSLIPVTDVGFLQDLSSLWDRKPDWRKGTKDHGKFDISDPYVTMLLGGQPAWINVVMNNRVAGMGIASRVMFVYSDDEIDEEMFLPEPGPNHFGNILRAVPIIHDARGYVPFDKEAQRLANEWKAAKYPTIDGKKFVPPPVLEHYRKRRKEHMGKLALIYAMARHPNELVIKKGDVESAMDTLFQTETGLTAVANAWGGNPYRLEGIDLEKRVRERWEANGHKAIPEQDIMDWIDRAIPTKDQKAFLATLEARGAIRALDPDAKWKHYVPGGDGLK